MTTTINISLPHDLYEDAKRIIKQRRFASMSELVRDALRRTLYPEVTVNGFTPEFEDEVLMAEAEPKENNSVWETEADVDKYFRDLKKKIQKNLKNG